MGFFAIPIVCGGTGSKASAASQLILRVAISCVAQPPSAGGHSGPRLGGTAAGRCVTSLTRNSSCDEALGRRLGQDGADTIPGRRVVAFRRDDGEKSVDHGGIQLRALVADELSDGLIVR